MAIEGVVPSARVLFVRDKGGREMCSGSDSQWGKVDEGWASNCGLASVSVWACGVSVWAEEVSVIEFEGGDPRESGVVA